MGKGSNQILDGRTGKKKSNHQLVNENGPRSLLEKRAGLPGWGSEKKIVCKYTRVFKWEQPQHSSSLGERQDICPKMDWRGRVDGEIELKNPPSFSLKRLSPLSLSVDMYISVCAQEKSKPFSNYIYPPPPTVSNMSKS